MTELRLPEKVVFVCATYLPRVTGVATALHGWANQLLRLGVQTTVVAPEYPPCPYYPPPVYPEGLQVVRLPSRPVPLIPGIQTPLMRGSAWQNLLSSLRGQRALVHGQDVLLAGRIALQIGHACRLPVLLHCHYPLGEGDQSAWLPFPLGRFGSRVVDRTLNYIACRQARALCRKADMVAVVSPYIESLFHQYRIAAPTLIPCGIEPPAQNAALDIRKRHGIPLDSPIFLYVGRLDPDKGIDALLQAAFVLRAQEPRARLLLVGSGPYLEHYKKQAEALRLENTVIFAGWVPPQDVWPYYAQADLFVIASPYEAQGLVVLEAQTAGLPVVGYRGGGVSAAIADGRNGLLTTHSPRALAAAALALWQDPPRRRAMGEAARALGQAYAIANVFPMLHDAYARLTS